MVGSKRKIRVGSDFSGVGAFNQALMRLGVDYEEVFACDMDKFARETFIHNYGMPGYYPENVYDREIPSESLDVYMTSPPCQAFSIAGRRLGKDDERGILFFNSHEFIKVNKPRFFIFENVRGLLSDDKANKKDKYGRTFQEWIDMLGGKSVNGVKTMFGHIDAVPYHLHWRVINAKDHGVPQNRERVFLIGIRDDEDNNFQFPKEEPLVKRLRDVLDDEVDDKFYLSEKMLEKITFEKKGSIEVANINKGGQKGAVVSSEGSHVGCLSATDYKLPKLVKMEYGNKRLNETLDKHELPLDKPMIIDAYNKSIHEDMITLTTRVNASNCTFLSNPKIHNCITEAIGRQGSSKEFINSCKKIIKESNQIRRLTPRECFRLMDFPETFTWPVSDSQAYKQAGNSIVVSVLYKILKELLKNDN